MNNKLIGNKNNIVFYTDEEGNTKIEVVLQNEDVWLNVNAIAELFDVQRPAIYKHISNIFTEEELEEKSVCSILEYTASLFIATSIDYDKIHLKLWKFRKSIDFVNKISYNEYTSKDTFEVSLSKSNVNRHPVGEI